MYHIDKRLDPKRPLISDEVIALRVYRSVLRDFKISFTTKAYTNNNRISKQRSDNKALPPDYLLKPQYMFCEHYSFI